MFSECTQRIFWWSLHKICRCTQIQQYFQCSYLYSSLLRSGLSQHTVTSGFTMKDFSELNKWTIFNKCTGWLYCRLHKGMVQRAPEMIGLILAALCFSGSLCVGCICAYEPHVKWTVKQRFSITLIWKSFTPMSRLELHTANPVCFRFFELSTTAPFISLGYVASDI